MATSLDQELDKLLNSVIIPGGGVMPHINAELFKNFDEKQIKDEASTKTKKPKKVKVAKASKKADAVELETKENEKKGESVNVTTLSERVLNKGQKVNLIFFNNINLGNYLFKSMCNNSYPF